MVVVFVVTPIGPKFGMGMTEYITSAANNMGQIEMLCCGIEMIWVSNNSAICLKCSIEKVGVAEVSRLLKKTKNIS